MVSVIHCLLATLLSPTYGCLIATLKMLRMQAFMTSPLKIWWSPLARVGWWIITPGNEWPVSVATNLISLRSKMKIAVKSDKISFPSNKLSLVKLQKSQSWREALLNESTSKSSGLLEYFVKTVLHPYNFENCIFERFLSSDVGSAIVHHFTKVMKEIYS